MNEMSNNFFWIVPLICMGCFAVVRIILKNRNRPIDKQAQPVGKNAAQIPEELKKAGQQVLDNLDWEIRLLEKQRIEATDDKRKEIEANLKRKKEEYQATIDRLES